MRAAGWHLVKGGVQWDLTLRNRGHKEKSSYIISWENSAERDFHRQLLTSSVIMYRNENTYLVATNLCTTFSLNKCPGDFFLFGGAFDPVIKPA